MAIRGGRERGGVVHCGAESPPRSHEPARRPVEAVLTAQSSATLPRLFLYTSGVWVYGDTKGERVDESPRVNPPAVVAPRVDTERVVLGASCAHVRTIVLRPGCVYGGRGGLTGPWFASAEQSGAAKIIGDGSFRLTIIHVKDLA